MGKSLLSVGLDVGTTTTQLIVSRLTVENRASGFAVPEMEITDRQIVYRSPVRFTPLQSDTRVDAQSICDFVDEQYRLAGIRREDVDTGAIIITGESSRKENARAVLSALSEYAGEFVVATAGPDLESVLAAKGAGALSYSADTGKTVLHMDVGGGTSNIALIEKGQIVRTGCLNVGGRLLKFDDRGAVTYVSPVLSGLCSVKVGDCPTPSQTDEIAGLLSGALEMAAGLRPPTAVLEKLTTREASSPWQIPSARPVISFSGGVADCIASALPDRAFGDLGAALGAAIRKSALCAGEYRMGKETIRATVIGAGCHSARLSGSTVFFRNVSLPVKNLPVVPFTRQEQDSADFSGVIQRKIRQTEGKTAILSMPGYPSPSYEQVSALAQKIRRGVTGQDIYVCLEADMAKALGQHLCLTEPENSRLLCIDRIRLGHDSYLDVGEPVGPAVPVVVKTLILSQ